MEPRTPLPVWALVLLWLVIIVLVATALGVVASRGLARVSLEQARTVTGEGGTAAPTAVLSEGGRQQEAAAQSPTPGNARPAGLVFLAPTPTYAPTPPPETPSAPDLPAEVLLREVPIGKQTRSLNCEFQTASDLAWYYGRPFTWEEIYQYVGHDVGGNPHKGFVGRSFDDKPGQLYPLGYGVYAEPIAFALEQLGLAADVSYDNPPEWLMTQLAAGRPVMVWTTSNMAIHPVATWTAADGVTVKGVAGEHTYLVVGYDAGGVWLIDPWDGQRHYFGWPVFLASWDLLDRMALVISGEPAVPLTPTPGP